MTLERTSLWHGTARAERHPPLVEATETDVVVVGGGITGLTTAAFLVEAGVGVVVVEARELAAGTTGGTTGKLTSQHGMIYRSLVRGHGEETARLYGQANQAAIQQVHDLCSRNGIDADLQPESAYVYAQTEDAVGGLRGEFTTARRLGLPAEWTENTDLPFAVTGALRFTDQAQMHAVKYCIGLARMIADAPHGAVHCQTRVTGVRERGHRILVETEHDVVIANDVVLATLLPITNRGFEFARAKAVRSYGIAAAASGEFAGMYISAEQPTRSIRHHRDGDDLYLVVAGESHEVGHDTATQRRDDALTAFAREHFGVGEVAYGWSSHDYVPDDRLPLVGTTALSSHIYVATGFQKWGLSNAMAAARLLTDLIQGRGNPLAAVFSPTRLRLRASARQFIEHNGDVAIRFVGDRLKPTVSSVDDIPPGGGATVRVDGRLLAVSRDGDGTISSRSGICSHLGCVVQWNGAERSWDCPCHGSRFAETGEVLDGPATRPLDDR